MKKILVLATALVVARALFESATLGGGTTGKSCKTCHDGGKGLGGDMFDRKQYTIMGMKKSSLEEVINICIENPLGGKAIDPKGEEMQSLVAYMRTLVSGQDKKKRKKIEGC